MEPDDYLYVYLYFLKTATKFDNTTDRTIVYEASKDPKFDKLIQKYGENHFSNVLKSLVNEMISQGIIIGVQATPMNIITGVSPIGYSILAKSKDNKFMNKLKKSAPKWALNTLTSIIISLVS
ncbi:hypothetical protein DKZ27_09310 [Limosilactobacillus reuteri]|uniref:Uncharacterized protein n=1 Tax=Limosilactobacillus reuteri TaxID=1598 RepID=A0A317GH53_LIMRT|nr:hypothetical protein [Limosilactobacillus reuteri]MCH5385767.1 hypothetical protein [Limosilactobacillus reuteri]PWT29932.1 hypothetical protein DKZ27_09310 [Limosilactobacillus reuteri]PWT46948.1 hypothetical protein DKZ23_05435 [Limosilactobacillus reuteri]PWT51383.1 hypothetical protein DKZ33_05360 [Limosilactobacillus reuteri]PWT62294.1 hypothetical protein DKZ32_05260 [Limosilactobacillus reuteri]